MNKKKIGFWKWLLEGIKDTPSIIIEVGEAIKKEGMAQIMIGLIGLFMTLPLLTISLLMIPIPIGFCFLGLHGSYNLREEKS